MLGKQTDSEGMAFDPGLRNVCFTCAEEKKGLRRGTHIEAETLNFMLRNFLQKFHMVGRSAIKE